MLRGLFTADGTVANYGEKCQYVSLDSSSLELLQQVQLLLLSFGIKAKLYRDRRVGDDSSAILPDGKGGTREYPVQPMFTACGSAAVSRLVFEREIGFHPGSPKAAALARAQPPQSRTYRDELTDRVESLESVGRGRRLRPHRAVTHHFVANGIVVHNCSSTCSSTTPRATSRRSTW